jgi:hypothetical protein
MLWAMIPFQDFISTSFLHVVAKILKGHGNEADFPRFLHKSVRHRSLTLNFEPFRFWLRVRGNIDFGFEFAEIFEIEKRLPDPLSRGVADSPTPKAHTSAKAKR